jgi:hypothetical protein
LYAAPRASLPVLEPPDDAAALSHFGHIRQDNLQGHVGGRGAIKRAGATAFSSIAGSNFYATDVREDDQGLRTKLFIGIIRMRWPMHFKAALKPTKFTLDKL